MKEKNIENEVKILFNLFNAGKFDLVISKTKKLIKNSPKYLALYNFLGSSYQNLGERLIFSTHQYHTLGFAPAG